MDVLYSLYHMMDSLLRLKGRIPLALFADAFVESGLVRKRIEQLLASGLDRRNEILQLSWQTILAQIQNLLLFLLLITIITHITKITYIANNYIIMM